MKHRIFPLGDNALTVEFGNEISVELNDHVLNLADFFETSVFEGFIEAVPAYGSLTIFYDVLKVRKKYSGLHTAYETVKNFVETALLNLNELPERSLGTIEIPICFDAEFALDLEFVASENNLSPEKVIDIFLNKSYRVFMLGFLPGFSYMGEVDERIYAARKSSPRLIVPKGSVGIAGRQTGIYSLESPGGWQIIGRTPLKIFTPNNEKLTVLRAGDTVKLYKIDRKSFAEINSQTRE